MLGDWSFITPSLCHALGLVCIVGFFYFLLILNFSCWFSLTLNTSCAFLINFPSPRHHRAITCTELWYIGAFGPRHSFILFLLLVGCGGGIDGEYDRIELLQFHRYESSCVITAACCCQHDTTIILLVAVMLLNHKLSLNEISCLIFLFIMITVVV